MSYKAHLTVFVLAATGVIYASVIKGLELLEQDVEIPRTELKCAIVPVPGEGHFPGLTVGHNYEMLVDFANSQNDSLISITLADNAVSYLDSLILGSIDILVLPAGDSVQRDDIILTVPLEGTTVWATRREDLLNSLTSWLETYTSTRSYEDRRDLFLLRYSPSRRAANSHLTPELSPYDDLIKSYAEGLGWDWRLLAAVIFHESKFHIEVSSPRGAQGLMQMRPVTAGRFGVEDLLNPEENIKAGAAFLGRLKKMFNGKANDEDELKKFVLAAYNAGEGRITDCINYADYMNVDSGFWDNIVTLIPFMRDSTILQVDTVKHGIFQGHETINYVDNVLSTYEDFKAICPQK